MQVFHEDTHRDRTAMFSGLGFRRCEKQDLLREVRVAVGSGEISKQGFREYMQKQDGHTFGFRV